MDTKILISLVIFIITYGLMFTMPKIRPMVSAGAAFLFVVLGSTGVIPGFRYTLRDALTAIDWNVLMMITGTMGLVFFFIHSGMPELMSDKIISRVRSVRLMILALSVFAGLISAFVDNVATVLMIAPVALAVCRSLNISPVPAIICIAISSNLQGSATLVGDTTSLLLAKEAGLDFMGFFFVRGKPGMFWVTEAGALVSSFIIFLLFRKDKALIDVRRQTEVKDKVPAILLVTMILSLIAVSFIPYKSNAAPGQFYKPDITNGMICLFFFLLAVAHQTDIDKTPDTSLQAAREIDYYTLALLAGLFVVIGGIEEAGLIDYLGSLLASLSGSGSLASIFLVYSIIVWVSVLLSAFIDNIPYTATMLPVVAVIARRLAAAGGTMVDPNLLYFGLMVGATLGGNLTPIGASANITGLGILRKEGYDVSPSEFAHFSLPITLSAVMTGYILVWLIWM